MFGKFLKFPLPDRMSQTLNSNEHASLWAHKYRLFIIPSHLGPLSKNIYNLIFPHSITQNTTSILLN